MSGPVNRYLVRASGSAVGSRVGVAFLSFGPLVVGTPLLLILAGVAAALDVPVLALVLSLLAGGVFFGTVVMMWVFLMRGGAALEQAGKAWLVGDHAAAIPLCHRPLATVFRADMRTKAFHVLGLCAEANGDFAEAADLFARAHAAIPAMAAPSRKRHVTVLALSHRAIALVATGRLDEADVAVREASALYPRLHERGFVDALTDDGGMGLGSVAMAKALSEVEPGRDPRGMLALASALVLAARGRSREAFELLDRERAWMTQTLLPRERALAARIGDRAHEAVVGGGPMRGAAMVTVDPNHVGWVDRVLPSR